MPHQITFHGPALVKMHAYAAAGSEQPISPLAHLGHTAGNRVTKLESACRRDWAKRTVGCRVEENAMTSMLSLRGIVLRVWTRPASWLRHAAGAGFLAFALFGAHGAARAE